MLLLLHRGAAFENDVIDHNKGYAHGQTGEYFRYKHMYHHKPSEKDRHEAVDLARGLRCEVCEVILTSLVNKVKAFTEDSLADILEADVDYEPTGEYIDDRMLEHKKGCNKHFKDEVVAQGYELKQCDETNLPRWPHRKDKEPCLFLSEFKPVGSAVDTYEMWKEMIFHACETTVSRYSDDLASFLETELQAGGNRTLIVKKACEKTAHCASSAMESVRSRLPLSNQEL
jgi:hypothetical protein